MSFEVCPVCFLMRLLKASHSLWKIVHSESFPVSHTVEILVLNCVLGSSNKSSSSSLVSKQVPTGNKVLFFFFLFLLIDHQVYGLTY